MFHATTLISAHESQAYGLICIQFITCCSSSQIASISNELQVIIKKIKNLRRSRDHNKK